MKREILINANPRETRVAILEDDPSQADLVRVWLAGVYFAPSDQAGLLCVRSMGPSLLLHFNIPSIAFAAAASLPATRCP